MQDITFGRCLLTSSVVIVPKGAVLQFPRNEVSGSRSLGGCRIYVFLTSIFSVFLAAFVKSWKATVSFVTFLSVCRHETTRLPLDGFLWNSIFGYFFWKSDKIDLASVKMDKNNDYFASIPIYIFDHISAHTVFMCFLFFWEHTATRATYSINWLVFITQMQSVYCAVQTGSLNKAVCASSLKG
jgi:hypothetical protein